MDHGSFRKTGHNNNKKTIDETCDWFNHVSIPWLGSDQDLEDGLLVCAGEGRKTGVNGSWMDSWQSAEVLFRNL